VLKIDTNAISSDLKENWLGFSAVIAIGAYGTGMLNSDGSSFPDLIDGLRKAWIPYTSVIAATFVARMLIYGWVGWRVRDS
jgi:hypothetical protein